MLPIIGQILGFIAFGIAFAVYQMKSRKALLLMQTLLVLVMGVHYFCLGAYPAMAMNFFCVLRNGVYYRRDLFKGPLWPILLSIIMLALGIATNTGFWSVLVILGLTINTYCISFQNPQHFRMSILVTSPMILVYDIIVFSLGGILMESISIASAVLGLYKFSQKHRA